MISRVTANKRDLILVTVVFVISYNRQHLMEFDRDRKVVIYLHLSMY